MPFPGHIRYFFINAFDISVLFFIRKVFIFWNEYFGSFAKYVKPDGLHVNFAIDPKYSCFNEPTKNLIY